MHTTYHKIALLTLFCLSGSIQAAQKSHTSSLQMPAIALACGYGSWFAASKLYEKHLEVFEQEKRDLRIQRIKKGLYSAATFSADTRKKAERLKLFSNILMGTSIVSGIIGTTLLFKNIWQMQPKKS